MSTRKLSRRQFLIGLAGATVTLASCSSNRITGVVNRFRKPPSIHLQEFSSVDDAETYDVCIIGSGPAGAILGLDLVANGLRTIILESGLNFENSAADERIGKLEIYKNTGEIKYPIASSRARALGGTSNLWTGRCSRLHPIDFEQNAYTPEGAGWPFTYDEIEPYYAKAEQTLRVTGRPLSKYHAPRQEPLPFEGKNDFSALQKLMDKVGVVVDDSPSSVSAYSNQGPMRAAIDLLPELTKSDLATLISGVTATKLIADADGTINGVEVQSLDKETEIIRARNYVVACGALESARLLLLSKSDAFPNGIGNDNDLVGRYFNEHPSLILSGEIPVDQPPPSYQLGRSHQYYDQFKEEGFGSPILVFYWDPKKANELQIGATLEMQPLPENQVLLDPEQKDYFGNSVTNLQFDYSEKDLATLEKTRLLIKEFFDGLGGSLGDAEDVIHWSHHHIGTCRMGNDPLTSVLDSNLRVHTSPNLYVLGSAAFVTGGAAHPTLAITALTHRLADHLIAV